MSTQREAVLWGLAIATAMALGLIVVWSAIELAFSRPTLAPLYFSVTRYRQDDYSIESEDAALLSPLEPGLEQEVIIEDLARGNLALKVNYLNIADQPARTDPVRLATITPSPESTHSSAPAATNVPELTTTNTPLRAPTNTLRPAATQTPAPGPTDKPNNPPKPTKLPKPTKVKDHDKGKNHSTDVPSPGDSGNGNGNGNSDRNDHGNGDGNGGNGNGHGHDH
jgi:hypothetical protein